MRAVRLHLPILLFLVFFSFATQLAQAQSVYGRVSGRLISASGTPVSGGYVRLTSTGTGARIQTTSDFGGYIILANLTADIYEIDVRADGFKSVHVSDIAVNAGFTTTVSVPLQPGDPNTLAQNSQAITTVLNLDRTDVSTLFDARATNDIPLTDRNVTELQLLVPGAAPGQIFSLFKQNPQNSQPVNLNGQYFSGSSFLLDGAENREPLEGLVVINPTLDSVMEMKVTTQGYDAEFGHATAGVVTIQTKSGSNAWHGDAFGFRRTGWGQSENPFDPLGVPPEKYSIFGGSVGGPIIKNKLFIFGDYQGTRTSQGANVLLSVPSAEVHNTCLGPAGSGAPDCDLSDYSGIFPGTLTDSENIPFPNDLIPNNPNGIDPDHFVSSQGAALLALLPLPNHISNATDPDCPDPTVCDNYLASGQEVIHGNQFDVRGDFNANSRLRLFARYSLGDFLDSGTPAFGTTAGGIGTNPSSFAGIALTRNQGLSAGFTYTLGNKLLTDFLFGFLRYRLSINAQDNGQTPAIGIPGIFAADTGDPFATGLPDFEIPGQIEGDYLRFGYSSAANGCDCPLREREQQFQFVNNWTRNSGNHIVKWGADFRFLQNYRFASDRPPTGFFSFAPATTGLGLATFLIGDVTSFERTQSSPAVTNAGEHQNRFGFYGQDTWHVNSRLTLNYGLRWEIYFPQTVTGAGGFLVPNLNDHNPATTNFSGPPAGGVSGNLTNFAPRLGFGYLVNPSTVIRAGYGRSFDSGYAGDIFGIAATQNPPVTADQTVSENGLTTVIHGQVVPVGGFNLAQGPPPFVFPAGSHFSLLDLATANDGNSSGSPAIPSSGSALYALPSRVRVPTVDSWNLTFQHELTSRLYFELAYVGNKGTHVFADSSVGTYYDLNQPSLQNFIIPAGPGPQYPLCKGGRNGVFPGGFCFALPSLRSFYNDVPGQFNPSLFQVRYFGNNANDNYNSLQTKVQKNFNKGYSFLAHYTWSKGLDYDANYFAVDPRAGYGPDSFDIRHRFVMTNIWELPVGRGKAFLGEIGTVADRFVGGWTISAITIWESGLPFTPSYANCIFDTDPGDPCRPNRVGEVHISGNREQYFTTTGGQLLQGSDCTFGVRYCGVGPDGQPVPGPPIGPWQRPGAGQIGDVGRNSFTGPGFFQSDIGLAKVVSVSEGVALRFRADALNAFNKVNLGQPNTCVACVNGATITSLAHGAIQRELQFSVRVQF